MEDVPEYARPDDALTPLGAHDYPWWVIGLGAAVLLAFGYALVSLPHHIVLARELAAAKRLEAARDYPGAEKLYASLLADMPESKTARLGMAHALFADATPDNDRQGMALLDNLELDRDEWRKLELVMPEAYREAFVEEQH